jgi:hypothetical protein
MKERQSALCLAVLVFLEKHGYTIGPSLRIPGAYAFEATRQGKSTTIGIKSSADRWVGVPRDGGGGWGLLSRVQELFVATFDDRLDPRRFHIIRFDPKKVIAVAERVYEKAEERGQTGIQWVPLDEREDSDATSTAAGHLLPLGQLMLNEPIEWVDDDGTEGHGSPDAGADGGEGAPRGLTIAQAKAGLAATFGVSPDAIKITIEG